MSSEGKVLKTPLPSKWLHDTSFPKIIRNILGLSLIDLISAIYMMVVHIKSSKTLESRKKKWKIILKEFVGDEERQIKGITVLRENFVLTFGIIYWLKTVSWLVSVFYFKFSKYKYLIFNFICATRRYWVLILHSSWEQSLFITNSKRVTIS